LKNRRNILLFPLSLIFDAVTRIRNFLYDSGILQRHEFCIPVICVGNITVGGTGKTPHSEHIIKILKDRFNVALLSRGYRRKSRGFRFALPEMSPDEVGDEPLQICRKFPDITVAVDADRVNGVKNILKDRPDTEVIILDDGFQHRRIMPGFTILLTDFNRLMIHDHLLPYGNLRESVLNMYKSDVILVTKCPEDLSPIQRRIIIKEIDKAPYQNLYFTTFGYLDPVPVYPEVKPEPLFSESNPSKPSVVLVTGIANAGPLKNYISDRARDLTHLKYPDHHRFTGKDIEKITGTFNALPSSFKFIITTEKDTVRFREFTNIAEPLKASFYFIPIGVKFLNGDKEEFDNLIIDYVGKNKRNNRISKSQRL
jgi:tetraacyldisaccharide 4'-kinase